MAEEKTGMAKETMEQARWSAVDDYICRRLVPQEAILDSVLTANARAGLPAIGVAPNQGKLLYLLASMKARGGFWRLERWAGTARSGWRARCLPMAIW